MPAKQQGATRSGLAPAGGARDGGRELYAAREKSDRRATKGPLADRTNLLGSKETPPSAEG